MTLDDKILALCQLAIESAADNDESLDGDRDAERLEYQRGAEACRPAHLSGYDTRGDAPQTLQKVIDSCYEAQAAEWAQQYPDRPGLYEAYDEGDRASDIRNEAEDWLDAALYDEYAFLQIEVTYDDSTVKWESRFTNEYNRNLGHVGQGEIEIEDFEALDEDALEKLAEQIAEAAYDYTWLSGCGQCKGTGTIDGGLSGDGPSEECPVCEGKGS